MKFKLVRFASVYFSNLEVPDSWTMQVDNVTVKTIGNRKYEGKKNCILSSEIQLTHPPNLTSEQLIVVPELPRKQAERSLETAVGGVSIANNCKRTISSPIPFIAFKPEDVEAGKFFGSAKGIDVKLKAIPVFQASIDIQDPKYTKALEDRLDGVLLLSEALSHDHVTGKFHELMRLFERAFKTNRDGLIRPLTRFLDRPYYTEAEIKKWVVELRNPLTHANKNPDIAFESDVRPVINSMLQAGYDVLFNKARWNNPSTTRRKIFSPNIKAVPGDSPLRIRVNYRGGLQTQILDGFSAYPIDLSVAFNLPKNYWAKDHQLQAKSENFGMSVENEL